MPTFDGDNLVMTLDATATQDVEDDWYKPWKQWLLESPRNRGYPQLFLSEAGGSVNATLKQGAYIRVNNSFGWRIRPPEQDVEIVYTGNLVRTNDSLPIFIPTIGNFSTQVFNIQPITTQFAVDTGSGLSGPQDAKLTNMNSAIEDNLKVVEGSASHAMMMRSIWAVICGKAHDADTGGPITEATTRIAYVGMDGTKERVIFDVVNLFGTRTGNTLDMSP